MPAVPAQSTDRREPVGRPPAARRREIEVLRAIAVALVVLHHVWTGRVSGGVDVFFVLSAFLLTWSWVRRSGDGRSWSVRGTIVARFARILPTMAVVLVAVLAVAAVLVPPLRWRGVLQQTLGSVTFTQNWMLAGLSVDYYNTDRADAPVLQHFWSMAVQGQVYVLWPLLLGLALLVARRIRRSPATVAAVLFTAVGAWSMWLSVTRTAADPVPTYFHTLPRLWEFAVGSLLALLVHRYGQRLAGWRGAGALGWAGVALLVACGFLQPEPAWFPGVLAWWPVGAAVLVILAGEGSRYGLVAALDRPAVQWVSRHSYSIFLWHWPVLVLWQETFERSRATALDAVAVVLIALVLTVVGDRVIAGGLAAVRLRGTAVVAAALALVLVPVGIWHGVLRVEAQSVAAQPLEDNPGARALRPDYRPSVSPGSRLAPYDADIGAEWANLPERCTPEDRPAGLVGDNCMEYRPDGEPTRTVVVLGDSRSQQWTAALQPIAEREGWHVISLTLHGCAYSGELTGAAPICNDFNAEARRWVLEQQPDAVVSVATRTTPDDRPEQLEPGYLDGVQPFLDDGIRVVALRDTPRFDFDVPACVQRYGADSPRCALPRSDAFAPVDPLAAVPGGGNWDSVDPSRWVCTEETCPPVIGNVYVYMDDQHLSRTYLRTMSDDFADEWFRATGW